MPPDPFAQLKASQREGWSLFVPLETHTTATAADLVSYSRIRAGQEVLDVGCGTGVVSLTAARAGAKVCAVDLSPALIEHGRGHAALAGLEVAFREGDVEALPYENSTFDAVVSQFGHMFAPRPEVAVGEMLRVLKPGGTIAFSTWPPEHFVGRMFAVVARFAPPAPPGAAPPPLWGDPGVIRQRLGDAVKDVSFRRGTMFVPALSLQHYRKTFEEALAPVAKLVATLRDEPERLSTFRSEFDSLITEHFENNVVRQEYLMTRAVKK